MHISQKIAVFGFVGVLTLGIVWYSGIGEDVEGGLGSSVLTGDGIDSISCTDVAGKIQDVATEKGLINAQVEKLQKDIQSLSDVRLTLDVSQKQVEEEKARLSTFEHNFFKKTNFTNADELKTNVQKITLDLDNTRQKLAKNTDFIRNRILSRKIRILERLQKKNVGLLTEYTNSLNAENERIKNKEDGQKQEIASLVQQIAQKESSKQNYATAFQQLETLNTQLLAKKTTCAQMIAQSVVNSSSANTNQNNGVTQTQESATVTTVAASQTGSTATNTSTNVSSGTTTAATTTPTTETTLSTTAATVTTNTTAASTNTVVTASTTVSSNTTTGTSTTTNNAVNTTTATNTTAATTTTQTQTTTTANTTQNSSTEQRTQQTSVNQSTNTGGNTTTTSNTVQTGGSTNVTSGGTDAGRDAGVTGEIATKKNTSTTTDTNKTSKILTFDIYQSSYATDPNITLSPLFPLPIKTSSWSDTSYFSEEQKPLYIPENAVCWFKYAITENIKDPLFSRIFIGFRGSLMYLDQIYIFQNFTPKNINDTPTSILTLIDEVKNEWLYPDNTTKELTLTKNVLGNSGYLGIRMYAKGYRLYVPAYDTKFLEEFEGFRFLGCQSYQSTLPQ